MAIEVRYHGILEAARDVFARRGFHQASIREIARAADLSLAGLYHYVGGKDELLFLVLDRALDRLLSALDEALAVTRGAEARFLALVRTHLEYGMREAPALKIVNRECELLSEPHRSEVLVKHSEYIIAFGKAIAREMARHGVQTLSVSGGLTMC